MAHSGPLPALPPTPGQQHLEAGPLSGEWSPPEPHGSRSQGEGESHPSQQAGATDGLEPETRDLQQLLSPSPPVCTTLRPGPAGPAQSPPSLSGLEGVLPHSQKLCWSHHHPGTNVHPSEPCPAPPPTCWVLDRGEGAPLEVEESVREGQW